MQLRHAMNNTHFTICYHLAVHEESVVERIRQLRGPEPRFCDYCQTDYETSVIHDKPHKTRVIIVTYHQLGRCRSRHEWEWKAFTSKSYWEDSIPGRIRAGSRRGDVKRAWESGEVKKKTHYTLNLSHGNWDETEN